MMMLFFALGGLSAKASRRVSGSDVIIHSAREPHHVTSAHSYEHEGMESLIPESLWPQEVREIESSTSSGKALSKLDLLRRSSMMEGSQSEESNAELKKNLDLLNLSGIKEMLAPEAMLDPNAREPRTSATSNTSARWADEADDSDGELPQLQFEATARALQEDQHQDAAGIQKMLTPKAREPRTSATSSTSARWADEVDDSDDELPLIPFEATARALQEDQGTNASAMQETPAPKTMRSPKAREPRTSATSNTSARWADEADDSDDELPQISLEATARASQEDQSDNPWQEVPARRARKAPKTEAYGSQDFRRNGGLMERHQQHRQHQQQHSMTFARQRQWQQQQQQHLIGSPQMPQQPLKRQDQQHWQPRQGQWQQQQPQQQQQQQQQQQHRQQQQRQQQSPYTNTISRQQQSSYTNSISEGSSRNGNMEEYWKQAPTPQEARQQSLDKLVRDEKTSAGRAQVADELKPEQKPQVDDQAKHKQNPAGLLQSPRSALAWRSAPHTPPRMISPSSHRAAPAVNGPTPHPPWAHSINLRPNPVASNVSSINSRPILAAASVSSQNIVWLDLETTHGHYECVKGGMNSGETAKILEAAVIVTDKDLKELGRGHWAMNGFTKPQLMGFTESHQRRFRDKEPGGQFPPLEGTSGNGLFSDVIASPTTLELVEAEILKLIKQHCPEQGCPLAGNSVQCDRETLKVHMADVYAFLSHQVIDLSIVLGLVDRWVPDKKAEYEADHGKHASYNHRAIHNTESSIHSMHWVRSQFFVHPEVKHTRMG